MQSPPNRTVFRGQAKKKGGDKHRERWASVLLAIIVAGGGYYCWQKLANHDLPAGIAAGNGRIDAMEIDIST